MKLSPEKLAEELVNEQTRALRLFDKCKGTLDQPVFLVEERWLMLR